MMENKKECLTGACPEIKENPSVIKLSEGSGGREMHSLISQIQKRLSANKNSEWKNSDDDSATIKIGNKQLFFTTDSFIVTPIFFPGGDIGKVAFCGTINDLVVQGADPLGLSLSLILEEGFDKSKLYKIIDSINEISEETGVPVVTGDTKVMENKAVDGIIINMSGVGISDKVIDEPINTGDIVIISGGIGEHGATLLSKRFELESDLITDCKPLIHELKSVRHLIKQAKDVTRGGLASILNELSLKHKKQINIIDSKVPMKQEVRALTNVLGLDPYVLACEGRFLCVVSKENSEEVLSILKKFNVMASIIGDVVDGTGVVAQTKFGKKIINMPSGNIVPRIC